MNYPKIRINTAYLLNGNVIPLLLPQLEEEGREAEADREFIKQKWHGYTDAWSPYETTILAGMCEALDLEFTQNTIDVYLSPFRHSFSDPMVISTRYTDDRFIDVLTHELLHRLLTDNTKTPKEWDGILDVWKGLFGEEHEWNVLVHIPVHLMLKYIFRDILHEEQRVERDKRLVGKYESYRKAWEYVEAHDYRECISRLRASYGTRPL